uniref:methionyl-tRNA formyltransferase n=1 Tax=Lygus hesperus TaxID=30085 RepID=A0A0A9WJL9_LYGHE
MFLAVLRFGIKSCVGSRNVSSSSVRGAKCSSKTLEPPWRILFFGNDHFALESLMPLNAKLNTGTLISALGVVTGKRTIVRSFSEREKLEIHEWPLEASSIRDKYHIGLVVSFGHMIPKDVLEAFPLGCINVHSSILPKYRGAAPIIHSVMNGDSETGVTIMKIRPHKFDVGEIVRQYRLSVSPVESSVELEARLAVCGGQMVMECLRDLPRSLRMAVKQPSEGVSYAPKVKSGMSKVDWSMMDALQIFNLHRAIGHLHPLKTTWHGQPIRLLDVRVDDTKKSSDSENVASDHSADQRRKNALDFLNDNKPKDCAKYVTNAGKIEYSKCDKLLKVMCRDGAKLIIQKFTFNGKSISALDFFNGYLTKRPKNEWTFGS